MRDLAEASGTSKALIHHHFGSKDDLYMAVKRCVIERYVEAQASQLSPDADPAEFLIQGMRTLFEFYRRNPSLVRLGTWAQLEGTAANWPGHEDLWRTIIARTRNAQQLGIIRDDIDPALLLTIAGALGHHWWQFRACQEHFQEHFLDQDPNSLDDNYLEAMIDVFLHGAAGPAFGKRNGASVKTAEGEAP